MGRLYAVCIVALILGACGTYTYKNTHARQTLMPAYPAGQWDDYVKRGGAFNVAR
jgi:hypothetical protein